VKTRRVREQRDVVRITCSQHKPQISQVLYKKNSTLDIYLSL